MQTITPTPKIICLGAAERIARRGWSQMVLEDNCGRLCMVGAIRACASEMRPGDFDASERLVREASALVLGVLRQRGISVISLSDYNDDTCASADEAIELLQLAGSQ